jgi:hypothetical protein
MVEEKVDWLHGFLSIAQKEYAFVTKYDKELYNFLLSGKRIAVKDVVIYELDKYEGGDKKVGQE